MRLFSELKRRNVLRMAVLYVVAAWLVMQVAEVVIGLADLPDWIGPVVLLLLAIGFPIALIVSWIFEITPEGIVLEKNVPEGESISHITGRRLDFIIIALLLAAVIVFACDKWCRPLPPEQSIAVLPLVNLSGDPDQEYFSDGISEEIRVLLAQSPGVKVTATTSSMQFKGSKNDVHEIAAALNVAHILEGSVRRSGERIRISVQLIKAKDSFQVWSKTYDRKIEDVFAIQDEIARAVRTALEIRLATGSAKTQPPTVASSNTEAHDAYLRGLAMMRRRDQQSLETAAEELRYALSFDELFAPAHAQLAIALLLRSYYLEDDVSWRRHQKLRQIASMHLNRAEALAPELSDVHAARALLSLNAMEPDDVIIHSKKALERNPSNADVMIWQKHAYEMLGEYTEASRVLERLLDIDPLSTVGLVNAVNYLIDTGKFAEARKMADRVLQLNPETGKYFLSKVAFWKGDIADALQWGLQVPEQNPILANLFLTTGAYDELGRIDPLATQLIDLAKGRYEKAAADAKAVLASDTDVYMKISYAEIALYYTGHVNELRDILEEKLDFALPGRPIRGRDDGLPWTLRLAVSRRLAGDERGAAELVDRVARDIAARRAAGEENYAVSLIGAQVAAFEGDTDRALELLATVLRPGIFAPWEFDDPIFAGLQEDPRFGALRDQYGTNVAALREQVMQAICFDNPSPATWQPLPSTCNGVE